MVVPKKILLVDDEAGIRHLLFEALAGEGFHVTLAKDGKESLTKMANTHFDLLITDLNMPRLDGMALLRKMKRDGRKEKVIVMTARPIDQKLFGKHTPPVFRQLHKPFDVGVLLEVVTSALRQPVTKRTRPNPVRRKAQKR